MPKSPTQKPVPRKVPLQIRIDTGTHKRITEAAEGLGVSLNALAEGILAWAMQEGHCHIGAKAFLDPNTGIVETAPSENSVWFGEHEEWQEWHGPDGTTEAEVSVMGSHAFTLDFSPQSFIEKPVRPSVKKTLTIDAPPIKSEQSPKPFKSTPKPKVKHP